MFASHQPLKKKFRTILFINRKLHSCVFCKETSRTQWKKEQALEPVQSAINVNETAEEGKTEPMSEDIEIEHVVKKSLAFDSIFLELEVMNKTKSKHQKSYLT